MDSAALGCPVRWASAAAMCRFQIAAMPSRANIDNASCSARVLRGAILADLPRLSLTIDLIPRGAQTGHAIPVHVALPRQEFFDRELVGLADRIQRHPAAADGLNNRRLAADGPPVGRRGCCR